MDHPRWTRLLLPERVFPAEVEANSEGGSILKADHEAEMPPITEWLSWDGELAPGYHYCTDLREVRKELLMKGKCPKVSLKSLCTWGALRYRCTLGGEGRSGWCVIREVPQGWDVLEEWANELGVEYSGQGCRHSLCKCPRPS